MALITWTEEYSVGIAEIDEQHKKLINMANRLYDSMKSGRGKEILQVLLEELLEYTSYHFGIEEELFNKAGYTNSEAHISEHTNFKNKVVELNITIRNGNGVLTIGVFNMMKDWINHHIMSVDKLYVPEIASYIKKMDEQDTADLFKETEKDDVLEGLINQE